MKLVVLLLLSLGIGNSAFAQTAASDEQAASVLVQTYIQVDAGELKDLLAAVLIGQSYESRVSVMSAKCNYVGRSMILNCIYQIGVDDMTDDDNGWGMIYQLEVQSVNNHVSSAILEGIAG